jgi:hypothetical protein
VKRALAALALASLLLAGCPQSAPPTTSLRVFAAEDAPKTAKVTIDDQPIGALATVMKRGVALPPGKHRITIEANGFFPWDAEVEAGDSGGVLKLDVKMVRIPD